jgi:hypothetical protein
MSITATDGITAEDIQRLHDLLPSDAGMTAPPLPADGLPDKQTAAPARPQLQVRGIAVGPTAAADKARRRAPGAPFGRPAPTVEIVVPVYNEEDDLEASVRRLRSFLDTSFPFDSVVTIADNASTDTTWAIARRLAGELAGVHAVHLEQKGRGRALRTVWAASDASVLAYMDVDLATDLRALLPLVAPLVSGHSDVAIGSRLARGARVRRGPKREFISRCYNLILRTSLRSRFSDAQCGFKAVRREIARELVPIVVDNVWFFDTELLVLAERSGLRIHEVPVDWVDDPDSRVDIWRTAVDDLKGVWRLIRTRPAAIGRLTPPALARRSEWESGAAGEAGRAAPVQAPQST